MSFDEVLRPDLVHFPHLLAKGFVPSQMEHAHQQLLFTSLNPFL